MKHHASPTTQRHTSQSIAASEGERGTAIIIAVMVMALLAIFVAVAIGRVTSEAIVMGNDATQSRTFYAGQASLETMTRNFNKIFETRIEIREEDKTAVNDALPQGFATDYDFAQSVTLTGAKQKVYMDEGDYVGLYSERDEWTLMTTAKHKNTGVEVSLKRRLYNNRIPLFQFGVFYDRDMDIWPGPEMYIGGRVHTNGSLFASGAGGLFFENKVTAAGEIVVDKVTASDTTTSGGSGAVPNILSNSYTPASNTKGRNGGKMYYQNNVFVTNGNATNQWKRIAQGSRNITGSTAVNYDDEQGASNDGTKNTDWDSFVKGFNGNLVAGAKKLKTPIQIDKNKEDPIQIIKRGAPGEAAVLAQSRYYNKAGIRISLDDSKERLPGCATVTTPCGRRLDGDATGNSTLNALPAGTIRGYQPVDMLNGGGRATRVNGYRFYTGDTYDDRNGDNVVDSSDKRQTWIKVELVTPNFADPSSPTVQDVTEDFLALGVTKPVTLPRCGPGANCNGTGSTPNVTLGDERSIIQLQQYVIAGPPIRVDNIHETNNGSVSPRPSKLTDGRTTGTLAGTSVDVFTHSAYLGSTGGNAVTNINRYLDQGEVTHQAPATQNVNVDNNARKLIPFPIKMYDVREGLFNADLPDTGTSPASWNSLYQSGSTTVAPQTYSNDNVPLRGVVSLVDIDIDNLRQLVNGDFNTYMPATTAFPSGMTGASIPREDRGIVLYVSDRRGDQDKDGVYDMENVYVPTTDAGSTNISATIGKQNGEDVGGGGQGNLFPNDALEADYNWESCTYSTSLPADVAATQDHRYFRRAVRLIDGERLPGNATSGLSVASENGVYVLGNYNATEAGGMSGNRPAAPSTFRVNISGTVYDNIPASIVSDAVTILSTNWKDGKSFRTPKDMNTDLGLDVARTAKETTVRAALLTGITKHSMRDNPNQGGLSGNTANGYGTQENLDGGVNNFPRLLENWQPSSGKVDLNYCGSMVSLFYSRVQNGPFKGNNGQTDDVSVFFAPNRNWNYDTNFDEPTKLPPGAPFVQYVQLTGFKQINE